MTAGMHHITEVKNSQSVCETETQLDAGARIQLKTSGVARSLLVCNVLPCKKRGEQGETGVAYLKL